MEVKRNPRDSMKSTWRTDKSKWGLPHWLLHIINIHPSDPNRATPIHGKNDPMPYIPNWQQQKFVLFYAFLPIVLHQCYISYTGRTLGPIAAGVRYNICLKIMGIQEFHLLRDLGYRYGFLDGDKHARDGIPDHSVGKVVLSVLMTADVRAGVITMLAYSRNAGPSSINWLMLPLELGLYGIVLDFWFYWYHRVMHQFDGLWKFHRTHHLTKHPNPLLTLYADSEQELLDIAGIPLLTYVTMRFVFGLPMGFYEWWVCQQFIIWSELFGHSGVRLYSTPPSPLSWLLALFQAELVTEDHDLHHRTGWKKSHNYGKQTRLWDRVFGTTTDRIESIPENIDFTNTVSMSLFPPIF